MSYSALVMGVRMPRGADQRRRISHQSEPTPAGAVRTLLLHGQRRALPGVSSPQPPPQRPEALRTPVLWAGELLKQLMMWLNKPPPAATTCRHAVKKNHGGCVAPNWSRRLERVGRRMARAPAAVARVAARSSTSAVSTLDGRDDACARLVEAAADAIRTEATTFSMLRQP